jgi:hypothetical protein
MTVLRGDAIPVIIVALSINCAQIYVWILYIAMKCAAFSLFHRYNR